MPLVSIGAMLGLLSRPRKCKSAAGSQTAQSAYSTTWRHDCRLTAAEPEDYVSVGQHQASPRDTASQVLPLQQRAGLHCMPASAGSMKSMQLLTCARAHL